MNPGEPLTVTMFDDPLTAADETGMYWFDGLPAGNYVVRELTPDGFVQTFPTTTDDFAHAVELAAGSTVEGQDFGNQAIGGSIHGTKFEDIDADGVRDPGPAVVIAVDRSGRRLSTAERFTVPVRCHDGELHGYRLSWQ